MWSRIQIREVHEEGDAASYSRAKISASPVGESRRFFFSGGTFHKILYNFLWHCDHGFKFGKHIKKVTLQRILALKLVLAPWEREGQFLTYEYTFHKTLYDLLWHCDHGFKFGKYMKKDILHRILGSKLVLAPWERVGEFFLYGGTFHKIVYNLLWHCDHGLKFGRRVKKVTLQRILALKLVLVPWERVGQFLTYEDTFHKILYNLLWDCDYGFKFGKYMKKDFLHRIIESKLVLAPWERVGVFFYMEEVATKFYTTCFGIMIPDSNLRNT